MMIYTMKVIFRKCQILTFFSLLECKNIKVDTMVNDKMATLSTKCVLNNV